MQSTGRKKKWLFFILLVDYDLIQSGKRVCYQLRGTQLAQVEI